MGTRATSRLLVLLGVCAIAVVVSIISGTAGVPFTQTTWTLSLPRLLMSIMAGASLAVAGVLFQSLFRNPLASPYTVGISSGASLAAATVILVSGGGLWMMIPKVSVAAFGGALGCAMIVYAIAGMKQSRSQVTLLLAGITVSFICSALIVLVLFLAGRHDLAVIVQWMMGSVEVFGFNPIWDTLAFSVLAFGLTVYLHRDLDLLMTGESLAASRGVPVRRVRMLVFMAGSLLTASIVAHCGPIGFVGLMVPHIARAIVGPVHRYLIPAAALTGAALLPLCDVIARNALFWLRAESRPLPVGVLTNVLGGMFFLYLLLRRERSSAGVRG